MVGWFVCLFSSSYGLSRTPGEMACRHTVLLCECIFMKSYVLMMGDGKNPRCVVLVHCR